MDPDVAFWVKLRRLGNSFHAGYLRQQSGEQSSLVQQFKAAAGRAFGQQLGQFVAKPFGGDLRDMGRSNTNRAKGRRLNRVVETGGKAHSANHAQLVLAEAQVRIAN